MARKRMIDPAIWTSESFGGLSLLAKIVVIGCISNADDEGRIKASPAYLKATVLPYGFSDRSVNAHGILTEDSMRKSIEKSLQEIVASDIMRLYGSGGGLYAFFPKWTDYQKINRPSPSRLPKPPESAVSQEDVRLTEDSLNAHGVLTEDSCLIEENRKERNMSANADADTLVSAYRSAIHAGARITDKGRRKIRTRLKKFSVDELSSSIKNFAGSSWWMEHNAHRGIAWFFETDDRIDQFLNLKNGEASDRKTKPVDEDALPEHQLWKPAPRSVTNA